MKLALFILAALVAFAVVAVARVRADMPYRRARAATASLYASGKLGASGQGELAEVVWLRES